MGRGQKIFFSRAAAESTGPQKGSLTEGRNIFLKGEEMNAKTLCGNVSEEYRPQVETLVKAVAAMQHKIDQQIPQYKEAELAQEVTVGTGETMLRQNPLVQEFRATVRDYAQALKNLKEIIEENKTAENISSLDAFRKKIKAVK